MNLKETHGTLEVANIAHNKSTKQANIVLSLPIQSKKVNSKQKVFIGSSWFRKYASTIQALFSSYIHSHINKMTILSRVMFVLETLYTTRTSRISFAIIKSCTSLTFLEEY